MKKRNILPVLLSGVTLSATAQQETVKPNIVVILADDLGTNELGCYGGANLPTPHIDRLADEGIRLTNNFASCAMSVPIRASLYTGLYPARHGSYQNHKASYSNLKSVTHYLSDLGYRVGRTGKDHPVGQQAVYNFEKIDGFTVDCVASHPGLATTGGIRTFIGRNDEQPFCLFVCSIHPHMPWDAGDAGQFNPANVTLPPNTVNTQRTREEFCNYLAEIKLLDDEVGAVMNVLEETGRLDNTLVIFLGEQGPQLPFGKWNCYRYSQNSAFIARYPAKIAPGATCDAIVQYEDLLPTMIDFAGGEPVEDLDGESFLNVLWGESAGTRAWSYGIHNNIPEGTAYPIRSIQDKRYKLILNLSPENDYNIKYLTVPGNALWTSWLTKAETDNNAKFLTDRFIKRPAVELYDLENDKWELNNLAALPEHADRIARMRTELERWMQQQGDRGVLMDTDDPEDPALKTPKAIGSIDDINNFVRNDLSGNYYLTNDIAIPEGTEWIPIGASSATDTDPQRFKGIFDGRGHSIKNLKIATESSFKGLFGRIDHAEIRNLDLIDVNIKGKAPLGGVSGAMIGSSKIERVSVSGNIEGDTEAGGIVGRIARDPTHTDYNIIHDCYVTANIKATSLSTNMNTPSCAGGIAAFMHSNSGNSVAKVDIRRVYVTGAITSEQKNNTAGNAAGILAFYDNNTNIIMEEVIVLSDTIGAATSNLFFSRRGNGYTDFALFDKVYARTGITLNYLNPSDKGRGGEVPGELINYFSAGTYKTRPFYTANLSWDFENVWYMNEGEYPVLRKEQSTPLSEANNPVARPEAVVTSGNMRFTVLTPEIIRIEWSAQNVFEDRASFVVVNRNLTVPNYTTNQENGYLYITTDKLTLRYKTGAHPVNNDPCDPNLQITMQVNGEEVVWYPGKKDPYNLKGTTRTLDNAEGDVRSWLEDGLISRSGWALIDEKQARKDGSLSLMFDGSAGVDWVAQRADRQSLDWYFLGYGHDYKKALGDFTRIAGKIPLPPLYVFGYWYSKYQRYSEQDMRNIVNDIKTNDIPLDVLVIDMDWHRNGKTGSADNTEWTGWSWNRTLFPDPAGFIQWLHSQNLKTTLNLHPADGIFTQEDNFTQLALDLGLPTNQTIPWNIEKKPFYEAFFNRILRPHEDIGVDFWWLDWQQWMIARNEENLGNTFWLNHVFFSDKKLQQKGRSFIFHRWGGLGNHRYPIGFSGDTHATFASLAFQPYFTATASNVGYGYWSHDIGGHQQSGANDPELYLRWIQYGVFSPVLRTHATNASNIERRIWQYSNFPLMRDALELRYALIPYIYTYARYAYDTGISLCRPMYYDYPERDEAYRYEGQYMFGNDILAAPVTKSDKGTGTAAQTIWLPEGKWYEAATGTLLEGGTTVTRHFTREQIPYYYREGAIIPLYPKQHHLKTRPGTLILQFAPGDSGECLFYEDEEDNDNYETNNYTFTKITQSKTGNVTTCTVHPRQGSFAGMLQQRAYRFELLAKDRPASVEFTAGQQGTYQYDPEKRIITVNLPSQSCDAALTVSVNE